MRHLVRNVAIGDDWYGPAHGNATNVPDDVAAQITNPAAWGEEDNADPRSSLDTLSKADLFALAEARQIDISKSATKAELIEALTAALAS